MLVEGIYQNGIVKLKNRIKIPENSEVFVVYKDKKSKASFMQSAGSWKDIDTTIFDEILSSRKDLRQREIKL